MGLLNKLKDHLAGKIPYGKKRSPKWPKVRDRHLSICSFCVLCGGKKDLVVHHIKPFHLHPELELDPTNLITLCESGSGGINCHLVFGHLSSFRSFNPNCSADVLEWNTKIKTRPMP